MPQLRVAIVGAGLMGRWHADAIARAGGRVVAVVDVQIEQARRLAGVGEGFRSLDDLDSRMSLDVVHICTPLATHVELAEQALMLGANVVVEKPLAADAESTAALLAVAMERRLLVVPVHQFVFQRGVRRLLSGRDRFGTLVRCVFEAATAGAGRVGLDPDDLVADILPHPLALFSRLTESGLAEAEWVVLRPTSGELRALTEVAGTTFEIVISTRGRPTRATLDVLGTTASAHADLFHGFAVIEPGSATRARKVARPFALAGATLGRASANLAQRGLSREVAYPGLRELVRSTHEAIAAGKPSPIDEREIIGVAAARDAILKTVKAAPPVRSE